MSRERRFRGEQDARRTGFDWQTLAREHGVPHEQARSLLQEALRRTSRRPWQTRTVYAELLAQARAPAPRPSPGKVTRTMRLAAGDSAWSGSGKAAASGKSTLAQQAHGAQRTGRGQVAPGKVTLTSYLKPRGSRADRAAEEAEYERLREHAWVFESAGVPLPRALQEALARYEPAPDARDIDEPRAGSPASGSGRSLPPEVQAKMERAFGADLSAVRIHEDPEGGVLQARAYARGTDLHFAPGRYDPHSQAGQALLGHELAHVVQQAQGRLRATTRVQGQPVSADPALEREADELGARAARGERVHAARHPGAPAHDLSTARAAGPAAVIARQVEDETPAVSVAQVLRHLREERWDVDSLAAQLTDAQMRTLSARDRVRLVDYIAGGHVVGNEDEQTIVRLLAATPTGQAGGVRNQLGSERLEQLDAAIDFDDYRDYHSALRALFFRSLTPEQAAEQMAGARVFPWADPGLIHSLWNARFYYEEVELHDDGKLHVRYWVNWAAFGMRTEQARLDPFEMIAVRFLYPEEYAGAERHQTMYMPAINLRGLHRHQFRNELQTAVDVALLLAGGTGLIGAGTRLARAIAALDLAMGAADLVIRDFRHELAESEEGRDFLAAWDIVSTLVAAYGVGRAVLEAPRTIQHLRRAWQRLRGTGTTGNLGRLDDQVDEVLDAADEVDDAARHSARDQDAPSGQGGDADAVRDGTPEGGPGAREGEGMRDREAGSRDPDRREAESREAEGTGQSPPGTRPRWNNRSIEELLDASEGRLGLPSPRGRQYPGHAGDHIPPEGASRAEVMVHAQRRPSKQNTTVYYNRRHAIQDLREALSAHADEIARMAPGQSLSFAHRTPLRTGFNSQRGRPPAEASWDEVTVALERLMDGELHLVHFSPRLAR